LCHRN
jgi:hypothetical protein